MKYRKKPVVITAHQVTVFNLEDVATWCSGRVAPAQADAKHRCVLIDTLEGQMKAQVGDYVIRGVKGEFYPCRPDIFEETYELEEDQP